MARKSGVINHTHRYQKRVSSKGDIWECNLDGCTHYIPLNCSPEGKKSVCWGNCGNTIILNHHTMQDDKPLCENCEKAISKSREILEGEDFERKVARGKLSRLHGIEREEVTEEQISTYLAINRARATG